MVSVQDLEGYCHRKRGRQFNEPSRKNNRDHLYRLLYRDLKRQGGVLDYDKYTVLRILLSKVKEGEF